MAVLQYKPKHSVMSLTIKSYGLSALLFHQQKVTKGVRMLGRTSISLRQSLNEPFIYIKGLSQALIWLKVASGGVQRPVMVIRPEGFATIDRKVFYVELAVGA